MDNDNKAALGWLVVIGWALLTAGPAAAVGALWRPAMGVALWLSANGLLYLLAAINSIR